jgi:tRNA nucleotidyltransferase (CCA-adding enzyme)
MPDYMYQLESRLSPEQRAASLRVQELARAQDSNVYLTGGAVRDLISGMTIRDLDFTVEGNPQRMVRELEKGGAKVVSEDERLRHYELIFAGDVEGSISGARDEVYERPGAKPEVRFSTVMEDLRRRDFSINAIAISLNPASRGLLLDPTNGLADLEKREVRALSIHAFTNQPIRLMRILRYAVRMDAKMESRTEEWFELALGRKLHEDLDATQVGKELWALGREDDPAGVLKQWEAKGLIAAVSPNLAKRHPDYEGLAKLNRARQMFLEAGLRARLGNAAIHFALGRLKDREAAAVLRNLDFSAKQLAGINELGPETNEVLKMLKGKKTDKPKDAYLYIDKVPLERLAFLAADSGDTKAMAKIRNYLQKWRPLRQQLPVAELESLGVARGPKFDQVIEDFFDAQLRGKGKDPEERTKLLKKLAGIKDEPKKVEEKKRGRGKKGEGAAEKTAGPKGGAAQAPRGKAALAAAQQSERAAAGKLMGGKERPGAAHVGAHAKGGSAEKKPAVVAGKLVKKK